MPHATRRGGPPAASANGFNGAIGPAGVTESLSLPQRARRVALENALAHGDVPRVGPVVARILGSDPALRSRSEEVRAAAADAVREVAAMSRDAQATALAALGGPEDAAPRSPVSDTGSLPELAGAQRGKVVLRLAPFPSGRLHIGNGRMIFLNQYYRERYDGKLLLVFDDTVGSEEKKVETEFFDLIRQDLELAGAPPDQVFYKSDRIPLFYPWARRVIEAGLAYVCRCRAELLRENRAAGRACVHRGQSVDATLELWEKMLSGAFDPGEAVLRLRTDMQEPDPAFRDRVLLRISDIDHPRVGQKYRVWPMLEFSWAVDDVELGVTHVLRGKDLVIEDRMEQFLWDRLGVHGPPFVHWGVLRVRDAKISKSKSYVEVKSGVYDGWADPRTWSLQSLDRRGIAMAALRDFTLSFGLSLADIEVPAESLYAENRKRIDANTVRRFFVADPVPVMVGGWPGALTSVDLANHPDRPELGKRTITVGSSFALAAKDIRAHLGEEIRLKDLANVRLPSHLPPPGTTLEAQFTSRENRRLPRVQWVPLEDAVPVDLLGLEGNHTQGLAEASVGRAKPREVLQFERVGFVRLDEGWAPPSLPVRAVFGHP